MTIIPLEADKAVVAFYNNNPAQFEINISDLQGNTVYYNLSKNELTDYRKIYDFSAVQDGEYEISLRVNDTKIKRNIEMKGGEMKVGQAKVSFDPFFSFDENILKISYLNFDESPVFMSIFQDNDVIFKSDLGKNFSLTKGYDVAGLQVGYIHLGAQRQK